MVVETVDEGSDNLGFKDVGHPVLDLEEAPDVTTQELVRLLINPDEVMLCAGLLTSSLVVVDEFFRRSSQESMMLVSRLMSQFMVAGLSITDK